MRENASLKFSLKEEDKMVTYAASIWDSSMSQQRYTMNTSKMRSCWLQTKPVVLSLTRFGNISSLNSLVLLTSVNIISSSVFSWKKQWDLVLDKMYLSSNCVIFLECSMTRRENHSRLSLSLILFRRCLILSKKTILTSTSNSSSPVSNLSVILMLPRCLIMLKEEWSNQTWLLVLTWSTKKNSPHRFLSLLLRFLLLKSLKKHWTCPASSMLVRPTTKISWIYMMLLCWTPKESVTVSN